MLPFMFSHDLTLNIEAYIKCLEEVGTALDWKGGYWKSQHQATEPCVMLHKQEKPVLIVTKCL